MMKQIVYIAIIFLFAACDSSNKSLYRPSEPVEEFVALSQTAGFQPIQFNPAVDILFVIDDSNSMTNHIEKFSENMKDFVEAFASHDQIDFHIGITTTWDSGRYRHPIENPNGIVPQFQMDVATGEEVLSPETQEPIRNFWSRGELVPVVNGNGARFVERNENFKSQLESTLLSIKPQPFVNGSLNTDGSIATYGVGPEVEELFSPVLSNLTDPILNEADGTNKGFWRASSHKVFVFLTDADDSTPEVGFDVFNDRVKRIVGGKAGESYSFYTVMHPPTRAHSNSCPKDPGIRGLSADQYRLKRLMDLTQGKILDICSDFGQKLAEVGEEIRQRTLRKIVIPLQKYPEFFNENPDPTVNKDWLEVRYGDQKIPLYNSDGWGWSWDPNHNLLIIRGIDQMEHVEGAEFSIEFTAIRLNSEDN